MKTETSTIISGIVGTIVGVVIGGGIGYLISEKKLLIRLEEEKKKMHPSEVVRDTKKETKEKPEENPTKEKHDQTEMWDSTKSNKQNQSKEKQKGGTVDYTGYSSTSTAAEKMAPVEKRSDGPYIIKDTDFGSISGWATRNIEWYAWTHVLVDTDDSTEVPIEDVGRENLLDWPEGSTLFVRNEDLATDYEIVYVDGTYEPYYT